MFALAERITDKYMRHFPHAVQVIVKEGKS